MYTTDYFRAIIPSYCVVRFYAISWVLTCSHQLYRVLCMGHDCKIRPPHGQAQVYIMSDRNAKILVCMFTPSKMKTEILIAIVLAVFYPSALNGLPVSCTGFKCRAGQVCMMKTAPCLIPPCPELPTCTECPKGLVFKTCGSACTRTCVNPNPVCILSCKAGCFCPDATPLQHNGKCIRKNQCPSKPVRKCAGGQPLKDSEGIEINCGMSRIQQDCPDSHFCNIARTELFGVCCLKSQACQDGLVYKTCGTSCPPTCEISFRACDAICLTGCFCPDTAPVPHNGKCIRKADCPAKQPDCRQGDTYKTTRPNGGMVNFRCGGIARVPCPAGYGCVSNNPLDPLGVCCPEACPTGLVYKTCGRPCPLTCENPVPVCDAACVPGCFCPDTAPVQQNGKCIRHSNCPPEEPDCLHGDPYKITGPNGNIASFRCGGIARKVITCPESYHCVVSPSDRYRFGVCCPSAEPSCPHGDPYKTVGPNGNLTILRCRGFACPSGYECIVNDRVGVCCPPACRAGFVFKACGTICPKTCKNPYRNCIPLCVPGCFCPDTAPIEHNGTCIKKDDCPAPPRVCLSGEPYNTTGPDGGIVILRCGGVTETTNNTCPAGYICTAGVPVPGHAAVCCPEEVRTDLPVPTCPHGSPYRSINLDPGEIFYCGGIRGIACPNGYECIPEGTGADSQGKCCPAKGASCPRGPPHKHPVSGVITRCGGSKHRPCPDGYICVPGEPPATMGTCCPKVDRCFFPKATGPCHGSMERWYYDEPNTFCLRFFTDPGCQGNLNQFSTADECNDFCRCSVPKDPGPCNSSIPAWYYDDTDVACKTFTYGGCYGNGNRFATEVECILTCLVIP